MDHLESAAEIVRQIKAEVARVPSHAELERGHWKRVHDAAERAVSSFGTAVRAVWGLTNYNRPVSLGSCVLLEIGTERFILTAAHVASLIEGQTFYLHLDGPQLAPNAFTSTAVPADSGVKDGMDFAMMRFPPELMAKLGNATFIPESAVGVGKPAETRRFTCLGYPTKMNKVVSNNPTMIRGALMAHTHRGRPNWMLPDVAVDGAHILVERDMKKARKPDGTKTNAFGGNGMSGGGIFDVGDLTLTSGIFLPQQSRLSAITIAGYRDQKLILGTRVDAIIRGLRRQNWL